MSTNFCYFQQRLAINWVKSSVEMSETWYDGLLELVAVFQNSACCKYLVNTALGTFKDPLV